MPTETTERISREEMWMRVAEVVALRGTCARLHVGAVVTDCSMTRALAVGYNGNAAGLPNACDNEAEGQCGCVHAELNAMLKTCGGARLKLFTTVAPCRACAKAIINAGVDSVYYRAAYRSPAGLEVLRQARIRIYEVCPSSSAVQ